MTPIESIYEIESTVKDLQKYLQSKDKVVSYRAQEPAYFMFAGF